jgi:hypothetical protein
MSELPVRAYADALLTYYANHPTDEFPSVRVEPSRHQWHLVVTQEDMPIHVPVTGYRHLCQRIGEMIMSSGISSVDVYRDGEQYRYALVSEGEE